MKNRTRLLLISLFIASLLVLSLSSCDGVVDVDKKCERDCQKIHMILYSVTHISEQQHRCWCIDPKTGETRQVW